MSEDTQELLIYDSQEPCPYLPDRTARMPLRRPLLTLTPEQFDRRLEQGDRRTGAFLYNTRCPQCQACEPIRIPVREFRPSATQRRTWRRGCRLLRQQSGPAIVDEQRIDLFNQHRRHRGLASDRSEIDAFGYEHFLVQTCCQTVELQYYCKSRLVAVAICDRGRQAMSAVYTFFDPHFRPLSLGVFSILNQIELCRESGMEFLYLGYYVAQSRHMNYKANYRPHQRRIAGRWRRFE